MFTVGVIGPNDLVDQAINISSDYKNIKLLPLSYSEIKEGINYEEAFMLVKKNKNIVDGFLFTGPLPYYKILKQNLTKKYLFYYPIHGTAIYKTLFKMCVHEGIDIENISIDTLPVNKINRIYKELGLNVENIKLNKVKIENFNFEKYLNFHMNLFKSGKTKAAVTTVKSIYKELEKNNIPVFRITPTIYSVKRTFDFITTFKDKRKSINNNITIQKIKIQENETYNKASKVEKEQKKIALYQLLLEYTRNSFGTIFNSNEEYTIIMNQNELYKYTQNLTFYPLVDEIKEKLSLEINIGIGLGGEVKKAEMRSEEAFNLVIQDKKNKVYVVGDESQKMGPVSTKIIANNFNNINKKEIKYLSKKSGLNKYKISKIYDLINKGNNKFTTKELAEYFGVSARTGNRIIKKLREANLAKKVGEEHLSKKGRPNILYEISFD